AVFRFTEAALEAAFLLRRRYMPYYKWAFKALAELDGFSGYRDTFELLLTTENTKELAETKYYIIEDVASAYIAELQAQGLTEAICGDLEKHAYSVNDSVSDPNIRNLNIFYTA
ncbi:MAG: DUF4037 domain-containing protein, partial [Clostridia bacterium]|nr:DUF4037 domain-containing protein [Clostridia bacterium]